MDTPAISLSKGHGVGILATESIAENSLTNKCIDLLTSPQHSISVKNIVTGSTIIFFDEGDLLEKSSVITQILSTVPMDHFNDDKKNGPNRHSESSVGFEITNSSTPLIQEVSSDKISTNQPVESLLNFGSLGINSLSALGPVITAMAGLLQKTTMTNHHNESTTTHPSSDIVSSHNVTTERSPIYIPVAEYIGKDIETAESQNVAAQIGNPDSTLETRHKVANNLVNGIPISPGEIITANSDVIVGKPGKLGPRPPQYHELTENSNSELFSMSVPYILAQPMLDVFKKKEATGYSSLKFDEVPAKPEHDTVHDPLLKPPSRPNIEKYANPNVYSEELDAFPNTYERPWTSSETLSPSLVLSAAHQFYDDHNTSQHDSEYRPNQYKENDQSLWILKDHSENVGSESLLSSAKINSAILQTEPIVHQVPHVIDRSTGQPLLVSIQPSQIANVVIPQGGLQALVFGDNNEPHISGQYFDDPSPYSQSQKFQSTKTILTVNSTAYSTISRPYDIVEIQTNVYKRKRPSEIPMTHYPNIYNRSTHGQVHTQILVHQPSDSVNTVMLKSDETPPKINSPLRRKYNQHTLREHPSRLTSYETPVQNIYYNYSNKNINSTISLHDDLKQQWRNHKNKTRLQNNSWLIPSGNFKKQIYTAHDDPESLGSAGVDQTYVQHIFSSKQAPKSSYILSRISTDESRNNIQPDFNHIVNHSVEPHVGIQYQNPPIPLGNIQSNITNIPQRHRVSSGFPHPVIQLELFNSHFSETQTFDDILSPANNKQTKFNIHTESNSTSYDSQAKESGEKINYNNQVYRNKNLKHSNFESPSFIDSFLDQKGKFKTQITNTSVNHTNMNQISTKPMNENSTENSGSTDKYRHPSDEMEKSVLKNKKIDREFLKQKSHVSSESILTSETSFKDSEALESDDATELNPPENVPYPTKSLTDPSAFLDIGSADIGFLYVSTPTHSRQESDRLLNQKYETVTSSNIRIQSNRVNGNESQNQISTHKPSYLILNTYESPLNIISEYKLDQKDSDSKQSLVSGSESFHSQIKLMSQPVQLSTLNSLVVHSEFQEPINGQDRKHHQLDKIKPFIGEQLSMNNHAEDNELSLKTAYHANLVTGSYASNFSSNAQINPRTHFKIPSREIRPPPLILDSESKYSVISENKGTGLVLAQVSKDVVGMTPPPPKIPKINENLSTNQRSGLESALKLFGINISKKFGGKNRPATSPLLSISMKPSIALTTRSVVVNRPSQNMVPPPLPLLSLPPTFLSVPPEIVNLRPAIAVSGSIQIATEVAGSNIPVMQDFESLIPIVHGTVDFPVSADFIELGDSIETQRQKYINKHTSQDLEGKHSHADPVSFMNVSPVIALTNSKPAHIINASSTMQLVIRPVHSVTDNLLWTSRETFHSVVILETGHNTMSPSMSRINPTKSFVYRDMFHDVSETSMNVNSNSFIINDRFRKVKSDFHDQIVLDKTKHYESSSIPINDILKIDTNKLIIPTITKIEMKPKEVTHFKTLTITRTETSIIGSPPTTRTILLTHTITSTIVETVTETLLRPTNVLATITSVTTVTLESDTWLRSHKITPTDTMDSIFIVMSDRNLPSSSAEAVEAEYGPEEEIFSRDEQDSVSNEFLKKISENRLGATLIPHRTSRTKCLPDCIPYKSEVCMQVNDDSNNIEARCICRPGFARMFADRPCKPTYTYTLYISLERIGHQSLIYDHRLNSSNIWLSQKFDNIIEEALDRTLMQSDLRDIYQNLNVVGSHRNFTNVEFNIQFTENTNEMRLKEVIKKYLAANNFSLGGTEVIASRDFEKIDAQDFDECMTKDGGPYHDCSPQAVCFNRRGYYECSCKEGWTDVSDNPLYTGRQCSRLLTGCSSCNYKGHCIKNSYGQTICECLPSHTGQHCQLNLKVLLISLVIAALILLSFLGICLVITCFKSTDKRRKCVKRHEIIASKNAEEDTFSEESITDLAIPHHVPHILPIPQKLHIPLSLNSVKRAKKSTNAYRAPKERYTTTLLPRKISKDSKSTVLNVMIPRAQYRMGPRSSQQHTIEQTPITIFSADETKLLRSMESGSPGHCRSSQISITNEYDKDCDDSDCRMDRNTRKNGALVSAGFQVRIKKKEKR